MYGWILEHPTRGVVTELPHDRDDNYHFSWSEARNGERVRVFYDIRKARAHRDQANLRIGGRDKVEVRKYGSWEVVE